MEPADAYQLYDREQPLIMAMWHGQHFMMPFFRRDYRFKVLISRHSDGEINAIAAERLGVGAVRGSGDHGGRFHVKGGVSAFLSMTELLADGWNVALTADVPKVSRVAGLGIIKLASRVSATNNPDCAGDQPPHHSQQLGSLGSEFAFQPRRHGCRRADPRSRCRRCGRARAGARCAGTGAQCRHRAGSRAGRPPNIERRRQPATGEARAGSLRLIAGYRIMAVAGD